MRGRRTGTKTRCRSMRRVVLGDDVCAYAAPVADRQALFPGPLPDRPQLLRASPLLLGSPPPPWFHPISPPCMLDISSERLVQLRGMLLVQVDLVLPARVAEPHGLHRRRPVQVVKALGNHLLHHVVRLPQGNASTIGRLPGLRDDSPVCRDPLTA